MPYDLDTREEALPLNRPRIGITRSGAAERISSSYQSYHDRVREAGGEPVALHPQLSVPPEELIAALDGLLLSGGADVAPARYGAPRHPETDDGDPPRMRSSWVWFGPRSRATCPFSPSAAGSNC